VYLHVAAPLACACCDAVLCADDVSSCLEERMMMMPFIVLAETKHGPRTPTAQSWALVAPECAVQVDVWSPERSIPCFLQPHRAGERWLRRGREASTGTSKPVLRFIMFFAATLSKRAIMETGEGGKHGYT
jgi:hypothetical protein